MSDKHEPVTVEEIDKRIHQILDRPEMWAISTEGLEASVLMLLWARDGVDRYEQLQQFMLEQFPMRASSIFPVLRRIPLTLGEYARYLKEWLYQLAIKEGCNAPDRGMTEEEHQHMMDLISGRLGPVED
jgi:hypothetical protein